MTSNQVLNSLNSNILNFMNSTQPAAKSESTDFSKFMADSKQNLETEKKDVGSFEKKGTVGQKKDASDKIKALENMVGKEKTTMTEDVATEFDDTDIENAVESIVEVIGTIIETIKEVLNISSEELETALKDIGITEIGLLNSDNVTNIVAKILGNDDLLSIATDENLLEQVNVIENKIDTEVETLLKDLDVTLPELKETIAEAEKFSVISNEIPKVLTTAPKEMVEVPEEEVSLEDKITTFVDQKTIVKVNDGQANKEDSGIGRSDQNETAEANSEILEPVMKENPISFIETLINRVSERFETKIETISYADNQIENIMNQVTESIKVSISAENTEVNLKLHPETLGNVQVRISANSEGTMTAQFAAQNESVKNVLESQIVVLKETLEAKGVSIEAVEVMVGTHEFDENLSNNERRDGQTKKKSTVRRIDLSMEEDIEDMTAEDKLQKEIMEHNGSTIDYTA